LWENESQSLLSGRIGKLGSLWICKKVGSYYDITKLELNLKIEEDGAFDRKYLFDNEIGWLGQGRG